MYFELPTTGRRPMRSEILPQIGAMKVADVKPDDIDALHASGTVPTVKERAVAAVG